MEIQSQSIASELQISELKQSNLYKSYEQFHSQASSMLVFSVQWKDLETHFNSTRKSIQTSIETLSEREKDFSLREKELATRVSLMESGFESKKKQLETHFSEREKASSLRENELATREARFESKKKEFESLEGLIHERVKEIELSLRQSDSLKTLIVQNRKELEVKEREFKAIESSIAVKSSELDRLKGSVEEQEKKLERAEDCVKLTRGKVFSLAEKVKQLDEEIGSKEREFESIHGSLRGLKNNILSEERVFKSLQKNVAAKEERIKACLSSIDRLEKEIQSKDNKLKSVSSELESKDVQVRARQSSIDQLEKEIQSKEEKLRVVSGSIVSCSSELELVRKEVESKEKSLVSLKNSADQISRDCERRVGEIDRLSKEFESKDSEFEDRLKEVESREKNFESLKTSLVKSSSDLETREKQFKKQVIEFESKQKKPDLSRNPNEAREVTVNTTVTASTRSRVIKAEGLECAQNTTAIVTSSASNRNPQATDGGDLRLLLNQSLKIHDSVCEKVFSILRASANPPKLALEAMEGLYPSNSSEESRELSASVSRRSCILMLEQLEKLLMEVSQPPIGCEVRDKAKRFAKNWRAKMKEMEMNSLEALGFLRFLTSFRLTSEFDPNEIFELHQFISTADKAFVIPKIERTAENSLALIMTRPPIVEVNTMLNICKILQESPDPARLVLQYIRRILNRLFSDTNVVRNCIILFDQLVKISPTMHPPLREDAKKVAADWRSNIESRVGSTLDTFVFLQFLETYDLVPMFDVDVILNLFMEISRDGEVLEVCRHVAIAKRLPDFIQYLIQKRNVVDAVRLICAFKLTDNFEPVELLTNYMDDLKEYNTKNCKGVKRPIEEKEKISDEEVTALKAIKGCIMENEAECLKFLLGLISTRIEKLENIRIQRRRSFDNNMVRAKADREERNQSPHHPINSYSTKRGCGPGEGFTQGRHKLLRPSSPLINNSINALRVTPLTRYGGRGY